MVVFALGAVVDHFWNLKEPVFYVVTEIYQSRYSGKIGKIGKAGKIGTFSSLGVPFWVKTVWSDVLFWSFCQTFWPLRGTCLMHLGSDHSSRKRRPMIRNRAGVVVLFPSVLETRISQSVRVDFLYLPVKKMNRHIFGGGVKYFFRSDCLWMNLRSRWILGECWIFGRSLGLCLVLRCILGRLESFSVCLMHKTYVPRGRIQATCRQSHRNPVSFSTRLVLVQTCCEKRERIKSKETEHDMITF